MFLRHEFYLIHGAHFPMKHDFLALFVDHSAFVLLLPRELMLELQLPLGVVVKFALLVHLDHLFHLQDLLLVLNDLCSLFQHLNVLLLRV